MSDTPLFSALRRYAARETLRMHMPGHKGGAIFPAGSDLAALDVTELADTGCLYDDAPPFSEANRLAARAWNAPWAMILAGGATLGIQAMLRCAFAGTANRRILVDRASHKSVYHALAINDLEPTYLLADVFGRAPFEDVGATFSPESLDRAFAQTRARALILTSPTYYGTVHDIAEIAQIAHRHGALVLVDEAHGAHFPFLSGMSPAVALGADMAVCSLHKTLPAMTGAALLTAAAHIDGDALRRAVADFGSSSPSFVIAASADCARARAEAARGAYDDLAASLRRMREALAAKGLPTLTAQSAASGMTDPLRLTVCTAAIGISGTAAAKALAQAGIVAEMSDARHVVCIVSAADTAAGLDRLFDALTALIPPARSPQALPPPASPPRPRLVCTPRAAWMAPAETVPVGACAGCVAAEAVGRYPPGVPLVAPGEEITDAIAAELTADPSAYPQAIRVLRRS